METDRLRVLRHVARHGSFSAAARALGRTQSALSQAVQALEQELGQRLLVRNGRGVTPTEAGAIVLEHAEQAFAQLELAQQRLSALAGLRTGKLVIGSSDTLAYYALPEVLAAFRDRHPGIELTLEARPSPATARAVAAREVDVGLVTLPLPPAVLPQGRAGTEALHITPLSPEPERLIVPAGHRLARHRSVALAALAREPLLALGRDTAGRAWLDRELREAGLTPRIAMEMNSIELLKRLTELGFGVAVVPARAVAREVAQGRLHALGLRDQRFERALGLCLPATGARTHAANAFAHLLAEHLRAAPAKAPRRRPMARRRGP